MPTPRQRIPEPAATHTYLVLLFFKVVNCQREALRGAQREERRDHRLLPAHDDTAALQVWALTSCHVAAATVQQQQAQAQAAHLAR